MENDGASKKRKMDNAATSTVDATPISTMAEENNREHNNNKTMAEEKPQNPNFNFKEFAHNSEGNSVRIQLWIKS